ncbi:NINE protein [Brevibacillus porteri]|uniref:NINE protein n=1 Tax=Brevibacillus TaxID=55080 RepID=UPI0020C71EED|nr:MULTISPECIES: NINE protein [unclassified Brevibacillus]
MDTILIQKNMTMDQKLIFQSEYGKVQKNSTTAILLCLFLGGLGAHQYYMNRVGLGIVYTLFCWTYIPLIISIVELFLLSGRVRRHNENKAKEIAGKILSV